MSNYFFPEFSSEWWRLAAEMNEGVAWDTRYINPFLSLQCSLAAAYCKSKAEAMEKEDPYNGGEDGQS